MKKISNSEGIFISAGFGTYPGYKFEDHARGAQMFMGTFVGIAEGLWNGLFELSK